MQNQTLNLEENLEDACDLNNSSSINVDLFDESEVPGHIPQMPPPEIVHPRERILSISAADDSFSSTWHRRIWCLLQFLKKIRPFGRRKEDIYIVK